MNKDEQLKLLDGPIPRGAIAERRQAGRSLSYLEGWLVQAGLNEIFGPDGWDDSYSEKEVTNPWTYEGRSGKMMGVGCTMKATLVVTFADGKTTTKEGYGAGSGTAKADGATAYADCLESAVKEAETDALKRAAKKLGGSLGNWLYDKEQRQVTAGAEGWYAKVMVSPAKRSVKEMPSTEERVTDYLKALSAAKRDHEKQQHLQVKAQKLVASLDEEQAKEVAAVENVFGVLAQDKNLNLEDLKEVVGAEEFALAVKTIKRLGIQP